MDFVLPLTETKNSNSGILNVIYKLSKTIRIIPINSKITTPEVANEGLSSKIISNRHSFFMSKFWKALFKFLRTKFAASNVHHPQADG